ncbi:MAG: hypothetical protein ACOYB8_07615 [Eubacteriaceae bacterium]|jgi:uncharacterized protein with PIN domain
MSEKLAYCPTCKKDVPYTISDIELTETIGDQTFTYMGKIARCDYCGTEVKVKEVDNFNDDAETALFAKSNPKHHCPGPSDMS